MTAMALLLSLAVFAIALLHASWGLGSHWPAASAEHLAKAAVGTPNVRRMPGPSACFGVAVLLAAVASWPLFAVGILAEAWPHWLLLLAGAGIAAVFLGRGLAGFTAAWRRRFSEQPFASLDRAVYSLMCLLLAAGYLALLIVGSSS